MTKDIQSPNRQGQVRDNDKARHNDNNVQTLTDLFDQLDRAAFKRALEHRDARTPAAPTAKAGNG